MLSEELASGLAAHLQHGMSEFQLARVRLNAARAKLKEAEAVLKSAEVRHAAHRDLPRRKMREGASSLAQSAAAPLADGDFESVRAMRNLRQPPATVQLVARCACSLLSVDIPGSSKVRTQLLPWDEAKKILGRSDFALTVRRFDAARLIDQPELVTMVAKRAKWSAAVVAASEPQLQGALTFEAALSTSSAVGALFGWCDALAALGRRCH